MELEDKHAREIVKECLDRQDKSPEERVKCALYGLAERVDQNEQELNRKMTDGTYQYNRLQIALADLTSLTSVLYKNSLNVDKKIDKILEREVRIEDTLQGHGQMLQGHGQMLQDQAKLLQDHGKLLQDHGKLLQDHGNRFDKVEAELAKLRNEVKSLGENVDLKIVSTEKNLSAKIESVQIDIDQKIANILELLNQKPK